ARFGQLVIGAVLAVALPESELRRLHDDHPPGDDHQGSAAWRLVQVDGDHEDASDALGADRGRNAGPRSGDVLAVQQAIALLLRRFRGSRPAGASYFALDSSTDGGPLMLGSAATQHHERRLGSRSCDTAQRDSDRDDRHQNAVAKGGTHHALSIVVVSPGFTVAVSVSSLCIT